MIINSVTSLIALLSITTLIIYFLYLNLDDIKFIIHSVIGSTFENFNETIDNVKLPTNVVDISLNEIIKNSNPLKNFKSGADRYCFIGDDKGRHCAKIDESDKCMSGEIFYNEQKCMHPELRY